VPRRAVASLLSQIVIEERAKFGMCLNVVFVERRLKDGAT